MKPQVAQKTGQPLAENTLAFSLYPLAFPFSWFKPTALRSSCFWWGCSWSRSSLHWRCPNQTIHRKKYCEPKLLRVLDRRSTGSPFQRASMLNSRHSCKNLARLAQWLDDRWKKTSTCCVCANFSRLFFLSYRSPKCFGTVDWLTLSDWLMGGRLEVKRCVSKSNC